MHCLWKLTIASCLLAIGCKPSPRAGFTDVAESAGIEFTNALEETEQQHILNFEYMYNGGGVAVGDVNGDGLADIFFTANQGPDKLYLNKGNLKFEDITEKAGVAGKNVWSTGACMADVNGDGNLDIYVCYSGKGEPAERANQLFINRGVVDGIPQFEDKAAAYGLDAPGTNSTQAVFFDYDRDGDLDMFLLNHATKFYSPFFNTEKLRSKRHKWFSNYLFRNDGGHFNDVSEAAGIRGGGNNFGLGVVASDINNDGWPDLYYTNDYEEQDFLLLNNHDGTFRDVTSQAIDHISRNGMGCDVADYNNDGLMDIVVLDMLPADNKRMKLLRGPDEYDKYQQMVNNGYFHQNMRNTLQTGIGLDTSGMPHFSETGQLMGISNTDWSWNANFADLDNDGYQDLFITNGYWRDYTNLDFLTYAVPAYRQQHGKQELGVELVKEMPVTKLSSYVFRNHPDSAFADVTKAWGLDLAAVSNGAAYADLDNDGDLDLVVNSIGSQARIYRNDQATGHYLRVQLKGSGGNTQAVGARVSVKTAGGQQVREELPVRGFQSSVDPVLHFGLGKDSVVQELEVRWPDGQVSRLENVRAGQLLVLEEDKMPGVDTVPDFPPVAAKALLQEIPGAAGIDFLHQENNWVDFKNNLLQPWQLSRQGPAVCAADVNKDGLEDVFIAGPIGQASVLYLQQKTGNFYRATEQPWLADTLIEHTACAFADLDVDGDQDLYVVGGGSENADSTLLQDVVYLNDGNGKFSSAGPVSQHTVASKSCVAISDMNRDGLPDIFLGGRLIPGKYGDAPASFLLVNESRKGQFSLKDVTAQLAPALEHAGMITDARWVDLNGDEWPDLAVTGEWMAPRIFYNRKGKLEADETDNGLLQSTGLWTSIVPADLDRDGDIDFIMGNLGTNTQFHASPGQPMQLMVNDWMHNGVVYPIICYPFADGVYPYPSRDELADAMPVLKKKFYHYSDYAVADYNMLFTEDQRKGAQRYTAAQLSNCWIENRGKGKFAVHSLPLSAQYAPIQSVVQDDFDGDGKTEWFCSGNFFPFRVQLGRSDAGKGFMLHTGKGGLQVKGYRETGVLINGDVRKLCLVKRNQGPAILVARNSGPVSLIQMRQKNN
ncbi:VCBS repeat-containing protein [Flavihumibacter petaseus]|uniref:ASPIC/UnbV domain-containing protein n=1 Tax=Flavihumibacter petaseus NBRC 106054 TaxID=1220578 RepID=A0A0E9MY33_9BACT|nr:VCBS repeat-containing protein [Flavihumibacter petaseus]GAO42035.1 hypothetical protein FPE01S_01_10480 [Flavihumibacter petaseus NBRC 106054]